MAVQYTVIEGAKDKVSDWSREQPTRFWDPSRKLLLSIRGYQHWFNKPGRLARQIRKLYVLRYRFWSVVTGSDIPLLLQAGGGLLLPHPNGVVIHPKAKIGINCLIHQQVTIGTKDEGREDVPVIGDHVKIYAGAKIIGPIRVGAHATIGANAVVLADVPDNATVVPNSVRRVR
jgi:serine O-acetyltransferase